MLTTKGFLLGEGFLGVRVLELHLKCRVNGPMAMGFQYPFKE
jgi:hypothetical protein